MIEPCMQQGHKEKHTRTVACCRIPGLGQAMSADSGVRAGDHTMYDQQWKCGWRPVLADLQFLQT